MATIPITELRTDVGLTGSTTGNPVADSKFAGWTLLANGDVGARMKGGDYTDKTAHNVVGAGSATIRGSNLENPDPAVAANWFGLSTPAGVPATLAAGAGCALIEAPLWISPIATGACQLNIFAKKAP